MLTGDTQEPVKRILVALSPSQHHLQITIVGYHPWLYTGWCTVEGMIDFEDCDEVLGFCHDAYEREDAQAIQGFFEVALTIDLSTQKIVNVLSATHWGGARNLNAIMGWKNFNPQPEIAELKQRFILRAIEWLDQHEPKRKYGLLRGFVPEELLGPKPQGTSA